MIWDVGREFDADRTNCIKCFVVDDEDYIVGGYDSGHLVVYEKKNEEWKLKQIIKQNNAIISIHQNEDYLVTNNNNAEVIFYRINEKN